MISFKRIIIVNIDEISHSISYKLSVYTRWRDSRIKLMKNFSQHFTPIGLDVTDHIWLPDLEIIDVDKIESFRFLKNIWQFGNLINA